MFNGGGGGGVPSSSVDYHHHQQQQQLHQFITNSSISSTSSSSSSIAARSIIIPNNNNNNMMLQTQQRPPSPIAIHHHHQSNSSSSTACTSISPSSSNNLNTTTSTSNFLSFDHHHPIFIFPPNPQHPLIPTTNTQQQHQDLFHQHHHHHQPPASNQLILRPPPPPTHQQHHHHQPQYTNNNNNNDENITITHHHHDIRNNGDHHEEEMNDHMIIKEQPLADEDEDSWSNDEVILLLKIKSTLISTTSTTATDHHESSSTNCWFRPPDDNDLHHFHTWDHVSRKLAEMGYKKSAEKCKDKFEEETCRSFGGGYKKNTTTSSSYLIAEELDEHLYSNNDTHGQNSHPPVPPVHESPDHNVIDHEQVPQVDDEKEGEDGNLEAQGQKDHFDKDPPAEIRVETTQDDDDDEVAKKSKKRKRKHKKFKMVKGLCVELVNRMMVHQEEMHRKLLQDMAIWDEEKIKREEAWRNEELDRVQREIQIREQEHEMAINRQSTITEFLNKITSFDQIPSDINLQDLYNIATNIERPIHSSGTTKTPSAEKFTGNRNQDHQKDDLGKRWPRDEVLALINMRSKVNSGNSEEHQGNDKGGGSLWERISQGMSEVGYKRSAKRCKEKWENINKYFRKTKDANRKRSLDSRTCPYYHELNKLYNQEKLASDEPENCPRPTTTPLN